MPSLPTELDFEENPAATPARMNQAMEFLIAYLRRLESVQPEFLAVTAMLKAIGLERLDAVLSPIFVNAQGIAAQLEAIRTAWITGAPLAQLLADLDARVTGRLSGIDAQLAAQNTSVTQRLAGNLADAAARLATTDAKIAAQDAAVTQRLADNAAVIAALASMSTRAKAAVADLFAWSADKGLTADLVGNAFAQQALAFAATLAWDWRDGFYRGPVTCAGNVTIATPTNIRAGETRIITLQGNDATARTVSFSTAFKGAVPQITDMTSTKPYRLVIFADSAANLTADARALA